MAIQSRKSDTISTPSPKLVVDNSVSPEVNAKIYRGGRGGGHGVDAETQRYVDAKVETVKAQNDARFVEVMSALGGIKADFVAQSDVSRARFEATSAELSSTREAAIAAKTAAASAEAAAGATKWNILLTGLTVAAILLGIWTVWGQAIEMTTGILSSPTALVQPPGAGTKPSN